MGITRDTGGRAPSHIHPPSTPLGELDVGPQLSLNRNDLAAEVTYPDMRTRPALCLTASPFPLLFLLLNHSASLLPVLSPLEAKAFLTREWIPPGLGKSQGAEVQGHELRPRRDLASCFAQPCGGGGALWVSVWLPFCKMGIIPGPAGGLAGME